MSAHYFDGFDAIVMRDFVADVLDAFNFMSRITSVKVGCSTSEKFALALELVRIAYALDEVDPRRTSLRAITSPKRIVL